MEVTDQWSFLTNEPSIVQPKMNVHLAYSDSGVPTENWGLLVRKEEKFLVTSTTDVYVKAYYTGYPYCNSVTSYPYTLSLGVAQILFQSEFQYTTDTNGNMTLVNDGSGDDAELHTGRALELVDSVNDLAMPTQISGYITYHDIDTNTIMQETTDGTDKVFTGITVNNILVHAEQFDTQSLANIQANPNLLAKLADSSTGTIDEVNITLGVDDAYYPCVEGAGSLVFDANSLEDGKSYLSSTDTAQVYTMQMPIGTSVTINGVEYLGNNNTNVVANVADTGKITIVENPSGCLTYFKANGNGLYGVTPDVTDNVDMTYLNLYNNQLTGTIPSLPNSLTYLNLYINQLTGSIPTLPSSLTYLNLGINQLTGTIPTLTNSLTYLNLYNNQLTGTIPSLPNSLMYLTLSINQLTGTIPTLPNSLTYLNLYNNQLTGTIPSLPNSLTYLNLYINQLTGSIPTLPNSLTYLDLGLNQLTGSIPSLPSSLTKLYLYSSSFSESAIDSVLCDADANCPSINYIALHGGNNEAPSPTGEACIDSLRAKGCTVIVTGGY